MGSKIGISEEKNQNQRILSKINLPVFFQGDDGHHLHADRRPGVPRVRAHLPAAARPLRELRHARTGRRDPRALARARRPHHVRPYYPRLTSTSTNCALCTSTSMIQ